MFKHIVVNGTEGIVVIEKQIITYCNQAFLHFLNAKGKEVQVVNYDITNFIFEDSLSKFSNELDKLNHDHPTSHFNIQFLSLNGSSNFLEVYLSKIDYEKKNYMLLVTSDDKSEQVESNSNVTLKKLETLVEKVLKESKEKYKNLYHKAPVMIYTIDNNLKFSSINDLWLKKLGYSYNEVIGKPFIDFLTKPYKNIFLKEIFLELLKKKQIENIYGQYLRKNGSVIDVLISAIAEIDSMGNLIQIHSVITDIIDKKKSKKALDDTVKIATNLQYAMNTASIIATISLENKILYINDQFCQICKYSRNELIKHSYSMLYSDYSQIKESDEQRKDMLKGKVINGEYKFKAKNGSFYWLYSTIIPFMGVDNKPEHFIEISYDITESKKNKEVLEAHNLKLKKENIELDKFVYSASHQLRSPLTSLIGLLNITEQNTDDLKQMKYLSLIKEGIYRQDEIIREITNYSTNTSLKLIYKPIDFRDIVKDILSSYQYLDGAKNMNLTINIKYETTLFCSDKSRLKVILNNLISNVIKYYDPLKKELEIVIDIEIGNTTTFSITDNGIGIHEDRIGKIFNSFYRGTTNSSGSGLGLFILKETLNKIRGDINVISNVGIGSCFTLKLHNFADQI